MQIDNTSGQGKFAVVPPQIDRWNWGAFLLNWIWSVVNSTFIALLAFVPLVNIVMPFILGIKGSAWAWKNRRWNSVEHFQAVQRKWAWSALAIYALMLALAVATFFTIGSMLKDSDAYTLSTTEILQNGEVQAALGTPISTGTPMGQFEVSGSDGSAHFQFSVEGPMAKGTAYVEAAKSLGKWELIRMAVDEESGGQRITVK